MLEIWKDATDKNKALAALLTDLVKAFDCFFHLLIAKLHAYGFDMLSLNLLHVYYFLIAAWLPHGQLWANVEGATSLAPCSSLPYMLV